MDAPYVTGDRGLWRKVKCHQREEFVIVGYTDPEGSRPFLGALLLAYYDDAGRLVYAGRAGTGMSGAELRRLYQRLQPLRVPRCSWTSRRRARPASDLRRSFLASIGCGPNWSAR